MHWSYSSSSQPNGVGRFKYGVRLRSIMVRWRFLSILRARLVHCNSYYIVIGTSITSNTRNWNGITIPIHLFGDNIVMEVCIYVKIMEYHYIFVKFPKIPFKKRYCRVIGPRSSLSMYIMGLRPKPKTRRHLRRVNIIKRVRVSRGRGQFWS